MESYIIAAWLGGLLMGWVVVLHFLVVGRGAGCSTAYACVLDLVHKDVNWFGNLDPFKFFFVIGLPLGGLIHALIFQSGWQLSFDMGMYEEVLPVSTGLKVLVLFIGGTLLGFGARMAGGCTTGHALVGGAMLSWASMFVAVMFFAVATITTWLLFTL
ncbi:MAG: YeeE/YedE thiosulfate transporter family protein [Thiotrichaceae bacterium]